MKRVFLAALALTAIALAALAGAATADTQGPMDFASYTVGNINGQNGWSNTGGYDANVVDTSRYGFGRALQISDAVTSGNFSDQTFSPGLASPASETGPHVFDASFRIGTTSDAVQPGLHLSVSPDSGAGSRMSYLRFEDQPDGIHVWFDDATDSGPAGTPANFSDTDIATLSRGTAHTVRIWMDLVPGQANDVVKVYIDGNLVHTGTSWEDYYRFDPEQTGSVPSVDKLLFREGGAANSADLGNGFLVDNVSLSSGAECKTTANGLTAAQIGGNVTGTLDATGCDIGVYYGPGSNGGGSVSNADIIGATRYGVYNDHQSVSVTKSTIENIGDHPFDGMQYGVGIFYTGGSGNITGNHVGPYQKGGITVRDGGSANVQNNTVSGSGQVNYIAQNGIQISYNASATVTGNTITGNWYTGPTYTACGLLFYQAGGVKQSANTMSGNQTNLCNVGRGGGNVKP
jgi:hypothetical protein